MAGGFGSVISFMFTFFVVVFTFSAIFYSYEKQVNDNSDLIKSFEKDTKKSLNTDFNIKNPFYMSGRLNFLIENGNNYNLKYMDSNIFCFTFIDNSMYVKTSNLFFNILKHIPDSYTFIEKGNNGIFSSKVNYNNLVKNDYKFISCEGKDKYYTISNGEDDWWNSLSSQDSAKSAIHLLAAEFDQKIYPKLIQVYGSLWEPGIDNDYKVTILISRIKEGAGGYFNSADEYQRNSVPTSNEREIGRAHV